MSKLRKILVIAGSDSSAGAGIQADLKTSMAFDVYALTVISALTAQNTFSVSDIFIPPIELLYSQVQAIVEDVELDGIKTGMLGSLENLIALETILKREEFKGLPFVLDPVSISTSGKKLLADEAKNQLKSKLIPLSTILTPNLFEAACLLDTSTENVSKRPLDYLKKLGSLGSKNVLLKGGHIEDKLSTDYLMTEEGKCYSLSTKRIDSVNTHGTGCSLATAICCGLSKGQGILDAVSFAKYYIYRAIESAKDIKFGKGNGPVVHNPDKLALASSASIEVDIKLV